MKKLKVIIVFIVVFSLALSAGTFYLLNSGEILTKFDIISVSNINTDYKIKVENVKAAKYYRINIHDSNNNLVYDSKFDSNDIDLSLSDLLYGESYSLMVYAYDELGDFKAANKEYDFKWTEPSFMNDDIMLNDSDYDLLINGDLQNKDYKLVILENDKEILNDNLNDETYTLSSNLYYGKKTKLIAKIMNKESVIDEITLYNNINPIGDVTITSPANGLNVPLEDISFSYTGGENAKDYKINIYEDDKLKYSVAIDNKNAVLSNDLFTKNKKYILELVASYDDYNVSKRVEVNISDEIYLKPVYISNNWKYIKKGTKIELKNSTPNAKIYYTLNGDNPESMGILYTEPIEINENTKLKTVAILEGYHNSIIREYDINVGKKDNLVVYLSPSNQGKNLGVQSVGYTNERDEMNDLSNFIEERLEKYGVKVVRNKPTGNINLWLKESAYAGSDLHIAIHSNASTNHDTYGIETWIYDETSNTYSLAQKIQDNLISIYPNSDDLKANRGVKYAKGALGEANDNYHPFAMLVEVAHHDYEEDALWIMQNKKLIGYNIADSILKYYQIID